MLFTKHLHEPIRQGKVTSSVRIWMRPHVKLGGRYRLGSGGEIEVTSIREITLEDITPELARRTGFKGVVDLLKTAKHGRGSTSTWWTSGITARNPQKGGFLHVCAD